MPLRLHPHVLPTIRRLTVRGQRLLPLGFRFRSRPVRKANVHQAWRGPRRQSAGWTECARYCKMRLSVSIY